MKESEGCVRGVPVDNDPASLILYYTTEGKDYVDTWYDGKMPDVWAAYNKMLSLCIMYGQSQPDVGLDSNGNPINVPHFLPLFYFLFGVMLRAVDKSGGNYEEIKEGWPR